MIFLSSRPTQMKGYVEEVWYSQGTLSCSHELVLPSGTTDIVVNLGPAMQVLRDEELQSIFGTTFNGLLTRPMLLKHPEIHEAIGIRLTTLGFAKVLGIPASEAINAVVDLDSVFGQDELVDLCSRFDSPQAKVLAVVEWLRTRLEGQSKVHAIVTWGVGEIDESKGMVSISEIVRKSGYSSTYVKQIFVDELGVTPKGYAKMVRFRAALEELKVSSAIGEIAHKVGYYDQSHMHRDFQQFAGRTPTEVLKSSYQSGISLAVE